MSAPQLLVQAVLNRLTSRLGSSVAEAAASLAVLAREAPEKLQQDWELFWEEVQLEAERLDAEIGDGAQTGGGSVPAGAAVWSAGVGSSAGSASVGSDSAGSASAPSGPDASVWGAAAPASSPAAAQSGSLPASPQEQIDQLRALVSSIARRLEERS
jgi:hypothetical protein